MESCLQTVCAAIVAAEEPQAILLYGWKRSPIDETLREVNLCLVVEANAKGVEHRLYRKLEADFAINLLVYTADDWARLSKDATSYVAGIRQKGVLLYGKA